MMTSDACPPQTHLFCQKPNADIEHEHDCPLEAGCSKGHTTFFLTLAHRHRKSTFVRLLTHGWLEKSVGGRSYGHAGLRGRVRSQSELLLGSD